MSTLLQKPKPRRIRRRIQPLEPIGQTRRFRIKSRTKDDGTAYLVTVNPNGKCFCNCPSVRPCWHIDSALRFIRNTTRRHSHAAIVMPVAAVVEPPRPRYVGIIDDDDCEVAA